MNRFSKSIIIKGLTDKITKEIISNTFAEYWNIKGVNIINSSEQFKTSTVAVEFYDLDSAHAAVDELHHSVRLISN